MLKKFIPLLLVFCFSVAGYLRSQTVDNFLSWHRQNAGFFPFDPNPARLSFSDCIFDSESGLPLFYTTFALEGNFAEYKTLISNEVFAPLTDTEALLLPEGFEPGPGVEIKLQELLIIRKKPFMSLSLLPFCRNSATGKIEKLISFRISFLGMGAPAPKTIRNYAVKSVLANGEWFKFKTQAQGVYKITYDELAGTGINLQGVHPERIKIYGNGGAMLPEQNNLPRADDLVEIAIQVVTASPDVFAQGDCILFYAQSPDEWKPITSPDNMRFEFSKNAYSDFSWYFLTISETAGKRIQQLISAEQPATHIVNTFHDYSIYKPDLVNLAKLGRQWFGDIIYGGANPLPLPPFYFQNIDTTYRVLVRSRFAVKANETSQVRLHINEYQFLSAQIPKPNSYWFANIANISASLFLSNPAIQVSVEFPVSDPSATTWIDYVEINLRRHLIYTGGQLFFRDLSSVGSENISNFRLANSLSEIMVWDITTPHEPSQIAYNLNSDTVEFKLPTPWLREFAAFSYNGVYTVQAFEPVPNQNLHALEAADMIIVSPEVFLTEALEYAAMRQNSTNLTIQVVQLAQIYNEFASGSPDPTAIRDFIKMLYDRAPEGKEPQYLLLFGDGSYDSKDRIEENNNFIPTYQSVESLKLDVTYVSDDYYGLLDDGEGQSVSGGLDIGIGRFPVNTTDQLQILKNKTEHYLNQTQEVTGNWRNLVTMIAHDEDTDRHFIHAEEIASYINENHPSFSVDKIYLDAYQRVQIPGGYRYPDVNAAINKRVSDGTLLINYIGHGGETGWAHSRVLTVPEINSWKNIGNMPVFITATCSFGRFDNPEMVSAGEMVVLNSMGGGIALFTTSRLAYSTFNQNLNKSLTQFFFERNNGITSSLGNVMMRAKNANGNNLYIRNFVLLGDPSLQPAIPHYNVKTNMIKSVEYKGFANSAGLSKISVNGYIEDYSGIKVKDFNGFLFPVVYDKPVEHTTNANHSSSTPRPFSLQNSVIYKGKISVKQGDFSFSFFIPRDVNPILGAGKISYFATDGETDANGYFDDFLVGGFNTITGDDTGPEIEMYLNTPDFSFGDPVNENPMLIVNLHDKSGINFYGLGIGRDIVAVLNGNTQNPILLNGYFEPDLDSCTCGTIKYHFQDLPEGRYTLRVKAFDLINNSSEAYTEFVITSQLEVVAGNLMNYPNPMMSETWFTFNHNYFDQPVRVEIDIFNLSGIIVKTIGPLDVQSTESLIEPVYWNGNSNHGKPLSSGFYPYRIKVQTKNGFTGLLNGKLMIIR